MVLNLCCAPSYKSALTLEHGQCVGSLLQFYPMMKFILIMKSNVSKHPSTDHWVIKL